MQRSLVYAFHLAALASATCYFPNGDVSPADVACESDATESFCCFNDQACLSNKLCLVNVNETDPQNYIYARGTCTDQNWQSDACPQFCLGASSDINAR